MLLELAERTSCFVLGEVESAYVARTSARDAYQRAMETCQATKVWAARARSAEVRVTERPKP
jgi:hypothetical protein